MKCDENDGILAAIKMAVDNYCRSSVDNGKLKNHYWRKMIPFWHDDKYWIAMLTSFHWHPGHWWIKRCRWREIDADTYWHFIDEINHEFSQLKTKK